MKCPARLDFVLSLQLSGAKGTAQNAKTATSPGYLQSIFGGLSRVC
jgi:hypothetical protein